MRVEENEAEAVVEWFRNVLLGLESGSGARESQKVLLRRLETEELQPFFSDLTSLAALSPECRVVLDKVASCDTARPLLGILVVVACWRIEADSEARQIPVSLTGHGTEDQTGKKAG